VTRSGMNGSKQHLDAGGLSGAVGPEESKGGAGFHRKGDTVHRAHFATGPARAEHFYQVMRLDCVVAQTGMPLTPLEAIMADCGCPNDENRLRGGSMLSL
jgi:hypothetical protein